VTRVAQRGEPTVGDLLGDQDAHAATRAASRCG
jgi:hypothetical protein